MGFTNMFLLIGLATVLISVIGGYIINGGRLGVLWQPAEFIIIIGAAIGAYIVSNSVDTLKKTWHTILLAVNGKKLHKQAYIELLTMLFTIFRLVKNKGIMSLDEHVDNPQTSPILTQFPIFLKETYAVTFFCDYLRLITLGTENAYQVESLIDVELETHSEEEYEVSNALRVMADGMPALGIVAAVLGVIHTMGAITQPPEILGYLIGGALVGTFLGVLMSYGFVGPIAGAIRQIKSAKLRYLYCIKAGLLAHLQGYPPAISIEFARKSLPSHIRPTFYEIEIATQINQVNQASQPTQEK